MLNYYYWYSLIWGTIIIFYLLGWSKINSSLDVYLLFFFGITIVSSLVLGVINRKKFVFVIASPGPKRDALITALLVSYFVYEFFTYGGVPVLEYLFLHNKEYGSFQGIKSLFVVVFTFTSFYSIYLFYMYICLKKNWRLLVEYMLLVIMMFLTGSRGAILMNLFAVSIMIFSYYNHGFVKKIFFLISIVMVLYLFGIIGNLRSGFIWNDSSFITKLGNYSETYPEYLPNEFMWTYSYLTSPLNNLNYNFAHNTNNINIFKYLMIYLPDFMVKRTIGDVNANTNIDLVVPYFNVSTGYAQANVYGGIIGMFIMYIMQFVILSYVLKIIKIRAPFLYIPSVAIANVIVAFFFFVNTLAYSEISLQIIYPLVLAVVFLKNKKYIHSGSYIKMFYS